jgi:hypothetical protein
MSDFKACKLQCIEFIVVGYFKVSILLLLKAEYDLGTTFPYTNLSQLLFKRLYLVS